MRRKKPSRFKPGAWNVLFKPGLAEAWRREYDYTPADSFINPLGPYTPPIGLDTVSGVFSHAWPTDQTCPTCQGHCEIFTGTYYEGEAQSYTCSDCGGQGVMLWMMPSTKRRDKWLKKFFEELIPLDGL